MSLTIFVSGTDTSIGKTWVMTTLAFLLRERFPDLQIIKPVQTGALPGSLCDAGQVLASLEAHAMSTHTLLSFQALLAPLAAAAAEGRTLQYDDLLARYRALSPASCRLIEGAGGLAVPLDAAGHDWRDFAQAIGADLTVLVVADRLGAINQARLVYAYAAAQNLTTGLWLNSCDYSTPLVQAANTDGLRQLGLPIWAHQAHGTLEPVLADDFRARLLPQ